MDEQLIKEVIAQVKEDIELQDTEALEELLSSLPEERLRGYLPEKTYPEE
jgi:hypothetical protein